MNDLWDATRPFAVWVYLGALVVPVLLGVVWRRRQVRGGDAKPAGELSRHDLAYLKGGPREVVLTAVRRLRRTGVLSVTDRGLIYATEPGRRVPDRLDRVIVAHAEHVFPRTFVAPLRRVLRRMARRLEGDGLLVPWRDVRRRLVTVVLVKLVVCVVAVALVAVALALGKPLLLELLFLVAAVSTVVVDVRGGGGASRVSTWRGVDALAAAGLRQPPRSGLRRIIALLTLLALLARTSIPVPEDDEDDPDSWAEDWAKDTGGGGDGWGAEDSGGDGGGGGGGGDGGGGGGGES